MVRVDAKGGIVIPSDVRRRLGIGDVVRLRVEGDRLVVEPVKDPVELLTMSTLSGTSDIEMEISMIRKAIDSELCKEVKE